MYRLPGTENISDLHMDNEVLEKNDLLKAVREYGNLHFLI